MHKSYLDIFCFIHVILTLACLRVRLSHKVFIFGRCLSNLLTPNFLLSVCLGWRSRRSLNRDLCRSCLFRFLLNRYFFIRFRNIFPQGSTALLFLSFELFAAFGRHTEHVVWSSSKRRHLPWLHHRCRINIPKKDFRYLILTDGRWLEQFKKYLERRNLIGWEVRVVSNTL